MPAASRVVAAIRGAVDYLLVLALVGLGEGEVWLGWHASQAPGTRIADGVLIVAASLALLLRRAAPVVVLGAILVMSGVWTWVVHASSQPPLTEALIILVAVYSAAAYSTGWRAWVAVGLLLLPGLISVPGLISGTVPPGHVYPVYVFVGLAWTLGWLIARQRRLAASLREYALQLEREREERARLAVTEERARIARELHDVVAHSVSLMVLQAGAARQALDWEPARAREPLVAIERSGREALAEMRRLLGILHKKDENEEIAPEPTLKYLQPLIDEVEAAGVEVRLRTEGEPGDLPKGLELTSYRILQEALTNSVKHAGPCSADVAIRYGRNRIEIEVVDDGDQSSRAPRRGNGSGHGLVGMRERAALYGGSLDAGPRMGGGYAVLARIPLEANGK
jgi:signal transduction histidine kinase